MLVTVEDLSRQMDTGGVVIVDCRFDLMRPDAGERLYREGHIPGAWYAHLDRDLSGPRTEASGRHPLPAADDLVRLFSGWGIGPESRVVAYDDGGGTIAARLWWLLRWMGHREACLLDGGLKAWQAAGLPLTEVVPNSPAVPFYGRPGQMATIDTASVERAIADRSRLVVDARAPARFRGEHEPIDPVAGHVPGAVNLPFQTSLQSGGRFRDPAALRSQFMAAMAGRAPGEVLAMCGSGVTACHTIFAMELAGLSGACLYAGSWSEWIRSAHRPVQRG